MSNVQLTAPRLPGSSGGGAPTGPAGGGLVGTYPNPSIANPITFNPVNSDGSISMVGDPDDSTTAGSIVTDGGFNGNGGTIDTHGAMFSGGSIHTFSGGSIDTSNSGSSIITSGYSPNTGWLMAYDGSEIVPTDPATLNVATVQTGGRGIYTDTSGIFVQSGAPKLVTGSSILATDAGGYMVSATLSGFIITGSTLSVDPTIVTTLTGTQTLTNKSISADQINSGTMATARLGSGTASSTTILYGDQTYKAAPVAGQVPGTAGNSTATAGNVGEVIQSLVASGSPVSLSNGSGANVTSLSLTAGQWTVSGNVTLAGTSATTTSMSAGVTSSTGTVPTDGTECYSGIQTTILSSTNTITLPPKVFNLASTTTIYLVGKASFSAGSVGAFGSIIAIRSR